MGRHKSILVGEKFGMLTVIALKNAPKSGQHAIAVCLCECGKEHEAKSHLLKRGKIRSCGCSKIKHIKESLKDREWNTYSHLPKGQASFNALYGEYKSSARRRNISFDLTKEQFKIITSSNCVYCGIKPKHIRNSHKSYNGVYKHNGIDRKINKYGYTLKNSQACCWLCNNAKKNLSHKEFKEWINRLIKHNNKNEVLEWNKNQ